MPGTDQKQDDTYSEAEREESIELRPDGEERFRAAVRAAARSGPKHRAPKDAKR